MPKSALNKTHRKKEIWKKAKGLCAHCGRCTAPSQQTIDHVIPQAVGGTNDQRNLMPLRSTCNKRRSDNCVDVGKYYKYAAQWALEEVEDYIIGWKITHTRGNGTLAAERNGMTERYG